MQRNLTVFIFAIGICFFPAPAQANPQQDKSVAIEISMKGELLIIDASIVLAATPREAWDVLTDYDHMDKYLHHLEFSKIIGVVDDRIQVAQKGKASFGPLTFSFDTVREVKLKPYQEIRSHVISGSVRQGDGTTRLIPEGNATRLVYHNESIPNYWVPPLVGPALLKQEVREQFEDMKTEILRRRIEKQRSEQPVQE